MESHGHDRVIGASTRAARGRVARDQVVITVAGARLPGDLAVPRDAQALVVFAHGEGSDRRCPRHREVARSLVGAGFATLLLDLRTRDEQAAERAAMARGFEVEALAARLVAATARVRTRPALRGLPIGYFGAGAGAAVALAAAALDPRAVRAVVSQAGRLDLVASVWAQLSAAVLLIVEASDPLALAQARAALDALRAEGALARVSGASHLFPDPVAQRCAIGLAEAWFGHHLSDAESRVTPWGPGGPAHCEAFLSAGREHEHRASGPQIGPEPVRAHEE